MSTPAELGLDTPGLNDLIRDGAGNITTNAEALALLWSTRGHAQQLTAGSDLNALTSGPFVANASTSLNVPPTTAHGFVVTLANETTPITSRIQLYYELGTTGRTWRRFRGSGSWTAWERTDKPRTAERLAAGTNLDSITASTEWVAYPGIDGIVNAPPTGANGVVQTFYVQELSRIQLYYELGVADRIWRRFRGSVSWTAWARVDAAYAIEQTSGDVEGGGGGESPSALKTLPVVLSASTNFGPATIPSGAVRFPFNLNAPVTRWRLHVENRNHRTNVLSPGGASFTGLWVGPRSGNTAAFSSAPQQALGAFTLPAGSEDGYTSPWVHGVALGSGAEQLLSLGWTGAGEATRSPAGCYRSTEWAADDDIVGGRYTLDSSTPFSWWLEVETAATTPVVAIWGDSISCGTGNDLPIHESPLSQYCRRIGAIPFHAGYPGTAMLQWEPAGNNYAAWDRFAGLSRPDAVLHFMGQNDLITADLAEMKRRFEATIGLVRKHLSGNIYAATITPTSTKTEAQNTIRKNYNNWLRTLPHGIRDVFEFGPAVANGADDALAPVYDSGDALHLSTAGSTALAGAVTRAVTTIERDTGWRSLPVANASTDRTGTGTLLIRRQDDTVRLRFTNVALTDGSGAALILHANEVPSGFGAPPPGSIASVGNATGSTQVNYLRANASWYWVKAQATTSPTTTRTGVSLLGEYSWHTSDPWPVTLPGTPA